MSVSGPTNMSVQRVIPPEQWRKKQLDTLSAVGRTNYLLGIATPKRSPIEAGSSQASEAKFNASMQLVLQNKRRMKGVAGSSDAEWFTYAREIGAANLVSGVTKREAKVADFIQSWHGQLTQVLSNVDKMATATLEERIQKSAENIRALAALHGVTKAR